MVRHGFTHFELEIEVYVARCRKTAQNRRVNGLRPEKLGEVALPTVMRKIVEHGLDEGGRRSFAAQTSSARKR